MPEAHHPSAPAWAASAGPAEAFIRGFTAAFSTPGYVLIAGSLGFGALVRNLGYGLHFAIFTSFLFYALPAQVVLADQLGRGASALAAAIAVSLTAVRLMPMAVTMMPLIRDVKERRWLELIAVHFIAVTAWIEANRRLPALPQRLRIWHFLGFGLMFVVFTASGASLGFMLAGVVPLAVSAALLFFTPAYFMMALLAGVRQRGDILAILLGVTIGPLVYLYSPGLDLAVAGLVGGSIAYASERLR